MTEDEMVGWHHLCNPMDCSPPGSSVHGILQTRVLGGLLCPPPGDLPNPGIEPMSLASPAPEGGFFTAEPPGKLFKLVPIAYCISFPLTQIPLGLQPLP